jgi:hypothetical protein
VAATRALPELSFRIEDAGPLVPAAAPALRFGLRIEAGGEQIRSVVLETQIQIAARQRSYDSTVEERLNELFGAPERWSSTLRTLPWTRTTTVVPPFDGATSVDLLVPCTYDFEVAASKYLHVLAQGGGDVPLEFLFSGTFFYTARNGLLQTGRIAWDREAAYRLPVQVWRETMDQHFPDSAWLRLSRDAFDRLYAYKARHAFTSWEATIAALVDDGEVSS